ncbi:MAG: YfhO family protein [Actinomycetota bacterium]
MSTTIAGTEAPPRDVAPSVRIERLRRAGTACAGPAIIAAGALFALRGFAFHPLLTNDHPDILAFWLPRFTFLGRELSAGHIPLWNPFEMLGYRFAADPQSGWLYVPPMVLFSTLSPGAAMRALIVFNPLLAGLGLFWFLRKESLSRLFATAGGLCLAMLMSTSEMAIEIPFAGFLGWTTIVLVGASGYRQADRWSKRLMWLALSAFAWSQVASAHMSHGLVMCSLLVAAYLVAMSAVAVREGELGRWVGAGRVALFLAVMPLASLPILLPRLAFIGSSSLHRGYDALGQPVRSAANIQDRPIATNGVWAAWPLAFGAAPGAYIGATMLLAVAFAWRDKARRALVWAFAGCFVLTWLLMLNAIVTAGWFQSLMLKLPFGDVYLHNPGRMRYVSMIAIPVLGAIGLQSLRDRPMSPTQTRRVLGGGVAVLLALPLALGGKPDRFILLAVATLVAVPALFWLATARKPRAAVVVVAVLGLELLASAVFSGLYHGGTITTGLETGKHPNLVPQVLRYPDLQEQTFLQATRFVDILRSQPDRYLTYAQPAASFDKGYLFAQRPQDWPALAMERGTLFGIPDVLGYNPVQLPRYWTYIRATNRKIAVFYNAAVIGLPSLENVRLTGTRYLIVPKGFDPSPAGRVVASADDYNLIQVYGWEPRVSLVTSWTVARPADALTGVLTDGFDPARDAYLERDPGISATPGAAPGVTTSREMTPEDVRITVDTNAPALVVVRNSYDPGWSATVDGRPTAVLATDYLVQSVAVPAGHHEVRLTYRDTAVARGAAAGALVWFILLLAISATLVAERRAR